MRFAYADGYYADIGLHVFPMVKFRMVRDELLARGLARPSDLVEPEPAGAEDVLRVHTEAYWHKVQHGFDPADEACLELPYSAALAHAFRLMSGGSIVAAAACLRHGFAANLGGGFHHACPGHGEGFCMLHDVAIAIRHVQAHHGVRKVAVVDTDVHQGNGTARVFAGDPSVFTFSIHQENNYPLPKARSDLDVGLEDGATGATYLPLLEEAVDGILDRERPELLAYVAGTDPFGEDQLGGLRLSREDMRRRDRLVLEAAHRRGVPTFVTFAGGYARRVRDTVDLHTNTLSEGISLWETHGKETA